jgi:Phage tail lysozyme
MASTEQQIVAFFQAKGLTKAQAAGIAGNVHQESSFNLNEPGGGLFQDLGGRGAGQGASLQAQLEAAWNELPANGLAQLKATKTPAEAARVFSQSFERPSEPNLPAREKYAEEAYKNAGSGRSWYESLWPGESAGISLVEEGVNEVTGPVKAATSATESVANFVKTISEPHTWLRVAEGVGGIILFMVGLKTLTRGGAGGPVAEAGRQGHAVRDVVAGAVIAK